MAADARTPPPARSLHLPERGNNARLGSASIAKHGEAETQYWLGSFYGTSSVGA